jgi:type VI secretion system protein ImpC
VANVNARLAAQLQCVMTSSRFAHYLKSIMRDRLGSFMSRGECERFLNRWISNYVLMADEVSLANKARYPLREARIDVSEMPGKPGVFQAVVFLRPHFQLEELTVSLRLIVELPTPASH